MRPLRVAALLVLLALAATGSARAAGRPSVAAVRASSPLRIDGVLDEPAWRDAAPITGFRLLFAREGELPAESTEVRILVDDRRLVFGVTCFEPHAPAASVLPRDKVTDDDNLIVHLDPDGEGRRAYLFGVNPFGVQIDGILTDEPDFQWDGVWDAETHREPGRWTAEIAIPFRTLRVPLEGRRPWRIWIRRQCVPNNEVASWPPWKQGEAGDIMLQAADLTGLEGVRGGNALFAEPFAAGTYDQARAPGEPQGEWDDARHRRAGLDVQAAVTSELTLNATLHPDFSQIESDALLIEANQRFPLQYDEKRPFFLEGGEVFDTPLDLLYTRRMANPSAGVKVAGRVGRVRTGALWVQDDGGVSMAGSGFGPDGDTRRGEFLLTRLELPLGDGNAVGVMGGLHQQDASLFDQLLPAAPAVPLASRNRLLSVDGKWRLSDRWSWEGQVVNTATRLDSAYADTSLAFPPLPASRTRQRFDGTMWVSRLRYDTRSLTLHARVRGVAPRYRNELGFEERTGVRYQQAVAEWRIDPKGGPLQRAMWTNDALVLHGEKNGVEYVFLNTWWDFQFRKNFEFACGFESLDEYWQGRRWPQERVHTYLLDNRWRPFTWVVETIAGDGLWYGDTQAASFRAWTETWLIDASVRPRPWLTAAANAKHFRVARTPTHGEVLDLWLLGLNANAQLTRRLSLRVYPQWDGDARHLDVNALLGWVQHPGTVVYVGVNGGWDQPEPGARRLDGTTRQVFAKVSWRFEG